MSDAEPDVNMTNDGVQIRPQLSQHKSNAKTHSSTSTRHGLVEEVEDDLIMTEAGSQESGNSDPPARLDNPATMPCFEGEVLDQAKGPPLPKSGLGGTSVRRQGYGNLDMEGSQDRDDNSSKV